MQSARNILRLFSRRKSEPDRHTSLTPQSPALSQTPLIPQSPEGTPTSNMQQSPILPSRALHQGPPRECNTRCREYNKVTCKRFCSQCGHKEHVVAVSHSIAIQTGIGTGLDGAGKCKQPLDGRRLGKCGDVGELKKKLEFKCGCCGRVWEREATFKK